MEISDTIPSLMLAPVPAPWLFPLAGRVRKVTALDQSRYMLEEILKKAVKQKLNNITTVNINWADAKVGSNVEEHDVVLVSRSLPSQESIISSLRSINMAARRSCYITWKADSYDPLESEICRR
jgi:precorrin-6B methylase 2